MPAPIAISKTSPDVDSFGSPRNASGSGSATTPRGGVYMNGYSTSITSASSGSFREAIAASFGKEASDIMDYSISRFSSSHASTDSDMTALPSTSYPRSKLETTFCRNFKCCGQGLENLHDLLQHYEESHVKFEDDDMPAMVADDDNASAASTSSASSSQPPSPKSTNTAAAKCTDTFEGSSAFDTTIMRSTPNKGGKKRSFGQFSNGTSHNANVHQSLRRALIDGGVGRGTSKASSVYSANSPFSTPGSSIPGTPTMDPDNETAFFGNGATSIPAFSSLSIRGSNEDHDLPSCAPPNLFFPAAGSSSSLTTAPPAKRERLNSINSAISACGIDGANGGPLGDRPYKCQSPGCDKAYKQMNGLKYHRLHGQCNQNNLPAQQQILNMTADTPTSSTSSPPKEASTIASKVPSSNSNVPVEAADAKTAAKASSSSASTSSLTTSSAIASAIAAAAAAMMTNPCTLSSSTDIIAEPLDISTPSPPGSAPSSPQSSPGSIHGDINKGERYYICQVGTCNKKYKNLNGLRYHYQHSGSHGLLGLQLLHTNGGGPSARADANTGRPAVSTNNLSSTALAAAAQAAAAQQQANQRGVAMQNQQE